MILAMIRPGKRYPVGNSWEVIEKEVWEKTDDYFFPREAHAIGYAMVICSIEFWLIRFSPVLLTQLILPFYSFLSMFCILVTGPK